jgi:hypothetical protein
LLEEVFFFTELHENNINMQRRNNNCFMLWFFLLVDNFKKSGHNRPAFQFVF